MLGKKGYVGPVRDREERLEQASKLIGEGVGRRLACLVHDPKGWAEFYPYAPTLLSEQSTHVTGVVVMSV